VFFRRIHAAQTRIRHAGTSLFVAKASKEIILSAGTIGTPQILLNSGIGDRTALEALGIPTLLDLPSVGKNASEHAYSGVSWAVNSNQTVESITQNTTRFNEAFAEWNRSRTGPFVDRGLEHTRGGSGWTRTHLCSMYMRIRRLAQAHHILRCYSRLVR
jgi:choline dehydrogenase-like flavoprotein